MTRPPPGTARSRVLALLILAGGLLAVALLVVQPLLAARAALDDEIAATRQLRDRFFARSAAATGRPADRALIAAPTAPVAAATLQTEVELLIAETGGTVERLEARTSSAPRRRARRIEDVEVAATFSATIDQLRRVLVAIDGSAIVMAVDGITVRTAAGAQDQPARAANRLDVELLVRGFRLPAGRAR